MSNLITREIDRDFRGILYESDSDIIKNVEEDYSKNKGNKEGNKEVNNRENSNKEGNNNKISNVITFDNSKLDKELTESFIMNINMNVVLDYNYIRNNMKPLDLILFKGNELVSKTIRLLQRIKLGTNDSDNFSHVGIIVNTTIIDKKIYPYLEDDKLYIFESTLSGKLSDGIPNVEGKSFFGTQVRDLDEVLRVYNTKYPLGWCRLKNNPSVINASDIRDSNNINNMNKITTKLMEREKMKRRFTEIFLKYNKVKYDVNIISLLASLFPSIRFLRDYAEKFFNTQGFLFCSELCFLIYQELGLYSEKIDSRNIVPADFIREIKKIVPGSLSLYYREVSMPILFDNPILFMDSK